MIPATDLGVSVQSRFGGKVVFSGTLEYEGAKKKIFDKNYKRRFVIITPNMLVTFKDNTDLEKPLEEIYLTRNSSIMDIDNYKKMEHTFGLKVMTKENENITMWFSASSDEDRRTFMNTIQAVIDEKKEGQRVLKTEVVDKIESGETKQVLAWISEGVYSKNAFLQIARKGHSHAASRDMDVDAIHQVQPDLVVELTPQEKEELTKRGYCHGDTLFHIAVKNEDYKLVKSLLEKGANINVRNTMGETPLHMLFRTQSSTSSLAAPREKRKLSLSTASSGKADRTVREEILNTILETKKRTLQESVAEVVKPSEEQLRKRKLLLVDINAQEYENGMTVLMLACRENDYDLATQILYMDPGTDVNLVAKKGGSAMHFAVSKGNLRLLEVLLKRGSGNVNIRDEKGVSVVDLAIKEHARPGMMALIFSIFEFGQPAIDFEVTSKEIILDYLYVITTSAKKLGQKGLAILEKILEHDSSLVTHAFEQDPILSLNITPIHYALTQAIKSENPDAVKILLRLGDKSAINLPEITKDGPLSPLHCAIAAKQGEIANLLIDAGSDLSLSPDGLTPLQAAMRSSLVDVALRLLESNTEELPPNMIFLAAGVAQGGIEIIKLLLDKGLDPNWRSETGETALTNACYANNLEVARYLIDEAGVDAKGSGKETYLEGGYPPIHAAVKVNSVPLIQMLLDRGVDINQCRVDLQMRPIHVAALLGKVEAIEYLIEQGVDLYKVINTKDDQNITALHLAAGYGHAKAVVSLIEKGNMNVDIRTANGFTPLDFSLKRFSFEVVKVLVDHGAASDQMTIQLAIQTGGLSDDVISMLENNAK
jgi:ankyrin repeat protein